MDRFIFFFNFKDYTTQNIDTKLFENIFMFSEILIFF